jgi:transposase
MSIPKDIKKTCKKTSEFVRNILNIGDKNINFPEEAMRKEKISGRSANVFTATLSYHPHHCEVCGCMNHDHTIIRHAYYESLILLIPYQEVPTYLRLYKQRFYCKSCHSTFSAKTNYVDENCYISRPLKFAIAVDLKLKISMKDIGTRYFVSSKSVERVLETFYSEKQFNPDYLPQNLLIDEFKRTKDCEGAMCFIVSDAATGQIYEILDDRRNFKLIAYFQRYTLKARKRVIHVVMDMNAAYDTFIKTVFPNAKISIDRFHVIQQITRAFNKQRIQVMNGLKKSDSTDQKNRRKLKKYWRTLLKKHKNINYESLKQFPLFRKKYVTESEVLDHLLSVNPGLKTSYDVYQSLLETFEAKNFKGFFDVIENLPNGLDKQFKKAIEYLIKHKKAIGNSLSYSYSNGKLEGKNNLIKVIKRIAFGFRTFKHLRLRVMIQQYRFELI